MVTVLADQHKVRFFGSPDLKKWEHLERLRPGRRDRRRVGVSRSVPAGRRRRTGERPLGARRGHQSRRPSPAARAVSTSSAPSTARRSSTTTRPIRRSGSTTARTSTRPRRSPTSRRPTAGDLDGLDQQLAVRQRGADGDLARRAVGPAAAGAPPPARRHSARAGADRGAEGAAALPSMPRTITAAAASTRFRRHRDRGLGAATGAKQGSAFERSRRRRDRRRQRQSARTVRRSSRTRARRRSTRTIQAGTPARSVGATTA